MVKMNKMKMWNKKKEMKETKKRGSKRENQNRRGSFKTHTHTTLFPNIEGATRTHTQDIRKQGKESLNQGSKQGRTEGRARRGSEENGLDEAWKGPDVLRKGRGKGGIG